MIPRLLPFCIPFLLLLPNQKLLSSELIASGRGADEFYKIRKATGATLFLLPEECFFPRLGLKLTGSGNRPDPEALNGGRSFEAIEGWQSGAQAEWGLWSPHKGRMTLQVHMEGGPLVAEIDGVRSLVRKGEQVTLPLREGAQSLFLTGLEDTMPSTRVLGVDLRGDALPGTGVLLTRWRPAAAHTQFSSSLTTHPIRMWVIEMDAVPGTLDFYSPITTPFGYYGPTWNADGTVNSSFNFSLWSYGRNQPEPPVEALSHLLAVGHPKASFGAFGHEGTGVKVRDWEPLLGRQGPRQALALRMETGPRYNTYFSYFYASDEKRWRLFGVGRQAVKKGGLDSLRVGSFVEVPGPPHVQRTGPYPRIMRYRGWVQDIQGNWFPLDTMGNGDIDKVTGLTYTRRGITAEGWFEMQTGGWTYQKPPNHGEPLKRPTEASHEWPEFMRPAALEVLQTVPSEVRILQARSSGSGLELKVHLRNAGKNPRLTLYYGDREALTLADRWTASKVFEDLQEGENGLHFQPDAAATHFRALLENHEGRFWSWETTRL